MKLNIEKINDISISAAITEFSQDGGYKLSADGLELTLEKSDCLRIEKSSGGLLIGYSEKVEIFRALRFAAAAGKKPFVYSAKARLDTLSLMADNSRNAVYNIPAAKRLVRIMAALGYNELQLYTEDTLTVENQPYFGHMRGRFTPEEIKEIDGYCANFGIELVPCIQTLAHLNAIFKWQEYQEINDCADILLVRSKKTYALLEDIIRSASAIFRSRKITIGMDEAFLTGAGKFHEQYGYLPRHEIIAEHLEKVNELCIKYGFKPMMWSDMFFRPFCKGEYQLAPDDPFCITPQIAAGVPKNMTLIYWDYYSADSDRYAKMFGRHYDFKREICFAGGAWKWSGFAPFNAEGLTRARAAAKALSGSKIKKVMVTAWADNGAECPLLAVLPQLVLYAEFNYSDNLSNENLAEAMKTYCDAVFDDFLELDLPNMLYGEWRHSNISKCLFYNDPLLGLADFYVREEYPAKLSGYAARLKSAGGRNLRYKYVFDMLSAFCGALSLKCTIGTRMKAAYDAGERETLRDLINNGIPKAITEIRKFSKAFRECWSTENKAFGREIMDIRIAGVETRLAAAAERLKDFLERRTEHIEELEQPRLPFDTNDGGTAYRHFWHEIASPSTMTRHQ